MKLFKILTVVVFFFCTSFAINAQKTKSNKATVQSKKKENKVIYKDVEYYIIDGVWYAKFKKRLVFKQAPKGAKVPFVPGKGEMVTMGGKKYYKCNGIFYKKLKADLFEVARP